MMEVHESQTAKFLKTKILEVLKKYELAVDQIFSVTTDNGANMIAAAKKLQEEFTLVVMQNESGIDNDEENLTNSGEQFLENLTTELNEQFSIVRCSIHTLQLALNDVVGNNDPLIKAVTDFVKQAKKIKYKSFFDFHKASYPPLWSATRWGGKYKMIKTIVKQETFFVSLCEQFPELELDDKTWCFMREYAAAFEPFYKATKLMQTQHQPFSEFYMEWLVAVQELKQIRNNRFVEPLLNGLTTRLDRLKQNSVFRASLYLDPRFNYQGSTVFTTEEKEEIQAYLIRIWERINMLRPSTTSVDPSNGSKDSTGADEMDEFLTNMYGGTLAPASSSKSLDNIRKQVKVLDLEQRQIHSYNIWSHWTSRKTSHSELYTVAMVVLATPSNQASVERAFSGLSLVLTSHRTNMTEKLLEDTLLLKLNAHVVEQVMPNLYTWKDFKSSPKACGSTE